MISLLKGQQILRNPQSRRQEDDKNKARLKPFRPSHINDNSNFTKVNKTLDLAYIAQVIR